MERKPTSREYADELLVVRCQLGERAAFDALVGRWSGSLRRYALKLSNDPELADDLTQDVWLRVLQGLGRLRDAALFRPWLFGIAHRTFMNRLWSRYAIPVDAAVDLQELTAADDVGPDPDLELALATGMAALVVFEREVLTLSYFEELSLADIASALHPRRHAALRSRSAHVRAAERTANIATAFGGAGVAETIERHLTSATPRCDLAIE